jgi:hypothetical protein
MSAALALAMNYCIGPDEYYCGGGADWSFCFLSLSPLQFKEISYAYEILSDAEKRQVYDRHGEERLKEGGGGGGYGSAEDLFSSIFGGGGFFGMLQACTALFLYALLAAWLACLSVVR